MLNRSKCMYSSIHCSGIGDVLWALLPALPQPHPGCPIQPIGKPSNDKERGYAHIQFKHQQGERQRVSCVRQAILFRTKMEHKMVSAALESLGPAKSLQGSFKFVHDPGQRMHSDHNIYGPRTHGTGSKSTRRFPHERVTSTEVCIASDANLYTRQNIKHGSGLGLSALSHKPLWDLPTRGRCSSGGFE